MIGHQTVTVNQHLELTGHSFHVRQKTDSVRAIQNNRLLALPTIDHVIECSRVLDPQGSGHRGSIRDGVGPSTTEYPRIVIV